MKIPLLVILAILVLIDSATAHSAKIDCSVPENQMVFHPHPNSCNLYIQCISETLLERPCPAGTEFSPSMKWCVHTWESDCVIEASGEEEAGTTEGGKEEESEGDGGGVTQDATDGVSDAVNEGVDDVTTEESYEETSEGDTPGETTTEVTENVTGGDEVENPEDDVVDEENGVKDEGNDENVSIDIDLEEDENDDDGDFYEDLDDYFDNDPDNSHEIDGINEDDNNAGQDDKDDNADNDCNDDNIDSEDNEEDEDYDNADENSYSDYPEIEDEADKYIPTPEEICQESCDRFFYSYHPFDCTAYIICNFGKVIELRCSVGEYFDPSLVICVKNSGECMSAY